jgi:hypothetical protein
MVSPSAEDRIAAIALGKAVAFLFYSFVAGFVVCRDAPFHNAAQSGASGNAEHRRTQRHRSCRSAVAQPRDLGRAARYNGSHAVPFSEAHLGSGCTVLSPLPLLTAPCTLHLATATRSQLSAPRSPINPPLLAHTGQSGAP